MADPLLTSLCAICHISRPQYKCPRCGLRTCSLPCIKKHKTWSDCSGERDPTVYKPPKELRTPVGIDHDYNFLHKLERTVEQTERMLVDEKALVQAEELRPLTVQEVRWKQGRDGRKRKVLVTRALREVKGRTFEKMLAQRLRRLNIRILCAPMGMERQKANKTTYNRKTGRVNWQVEWLSLEVGEEKTGKVLRKTMDDVPLYKAYHSVLEEQNKPSKAQQPGSGQSEQQPNKTIRRGRYYAQNSPDSTWNAGPAQLQEPSTGCWVPQALVEETGSWPTQRDEEQRKAFGFFLVNPRQRSDQPKVVTRLEPHDCLRDALSNTNVLEFPTIYVLRRGVTLPPGFVLGPKDYNNPPPQGLKRKGGPDKKGSRSAKKRKQGGDLEEGEVGSDNEDGDEGPTVRTRDDDEEDDGPQGASVGLEAGEVVDEQSLGEDDDNDDDDSPTSSSGTDSDESG